MTPHNAPRAFMRLYVLLMSDREGSSFHRCGAQCGGGTFGKDGCRQC